MPSMAAPIEDKTARENQGRLDTRELLTGGGRARPRQWWVACEVSGRGAQAPGGARGPAGPPTTDRGADPGSSGVPTARLGRGLQSAAPTVAGGVPWSW